MSSQLANMMILGVTLVYIIAGMLYCYDSKIGLGIAYVMYAGANVGLYLAARGI